ncbi:hypothetical protein [Actinophytocola sp.]|uniref:hypothetical protein n=1 Tax=Actinophytocola sp. TaxID=1872138 RepID=UPI003899E7A6
MSEKTENTEGVRISQVAAGALAAVTAAVVGSTMGVGGTIAGAGLASVISTVGGSLYLRSIQRTRESVLTVRAKVVGRSGGATVLVSDEDPERPVVPGEEVAATPATDEPAEETSDQPPAGRAHGPRRWVVLAATTVAAFVLGMLVITGVEWVRGESLSGDTGTTFSSIVDPHRGSGGTEDPAPTTSTTTPTSTNTTSESTATTGSTTTSTTPPSHSSTTTTTTTPPVTTTTDAAPPEGSAPASG